MVDNTSTPRPDSFSNTMEKHIETEGWEKEFDEEFPQFTVYPDSFNVAFESDPKNRKKMKDFITTLTSKHKKEMEEAVKRTNRAFSLLDTDIQELVIDARGMISKEYVLIGLRRIKKELAEALTRPL